jgi:hypothetical protein
MLEVRPRWNQNSSCLTAQCDQTKRDTETGISIFGSQPMDIDDQDGGNTLWEDLQVS